MSVSIGAGEVNRTPAFLITKKSMRLTWFDKLCKLIDDHVISLGVEPKIPPIALTDAGFDLHAWDRLFF